MKKKTAVLVILTLVISMMSFLTGCGDSAEKDNDSTAKSTATSTVSGDENKDESVDFSKYPTDINEWTLDQFNQYFTEAGVYTKKDWMYSYDHVTGGFEGYPIDSACGYADLNGSVNFTIYYMNPDLNEDGVAACIEKLKSEKVIDLVDFSIPVDHMIGNYAFCYLLGSDQATISAMDNAYKALVENLNITPVF